MKNSKIITFISRMEKGEFSDFGRFVKSRYHNKSKQVVTLYDFINRFYPNFERKKFSKEEAFKKLYPKTKIIDTRKVNDVMYSLSELLNEYLLWQELKQSKRLQNYLMANALERKTLDKYLYKHLDLWKESLLALPLKTPENYFDLKEINRMRFFYVNTDKNNLEDTGFEEMLLYSDWYFVAEKMRSAFYTSLRNNLLNKKIELGLQQVAEQYLLDKTTDNPIFNIYQRIIKLLKKPNHKEFLATKALIYKHIDELDTHLEKVDWVTFLTNYAVFQVSKGKHEYNYINYEIAKFGVEHRLFHEKGVLNPIIFANVVINGSILEELATELERFIEKHKDELPPQSKESFVRFAYILVDFSKSKFKTTINKLDELEVEDFGMNLVSRSTRLKCYFELEIAQGGYYKDLVNACEAHERFIKRHKELPERVSISNINFVRFIKRMLDLKGQYNITSVKKELLKKIDQTQTLSKGWLKEKIAAL